MSHRSTQVYNTDDLLQVNLGKFLEIQAVDLRVPRDSPPIGAPDELFFVGFLKIGMKFSFGVLVLIFLKNNACAKRV